MEYVLIRLNSKANGAVTINAAAITGIFTSVVGRSEATCIRTNDGNEWLVRESFEEVEAAIAAALAGTSKPAAMRLETKVAKKGEPAK